MAQWTYDQRQPAGHGTSTLPAAVALYVPLAVSDRSVGVLGIRPTERHQFRDPGQRRLLEALAGQAAVAFERLALAERSRRTEVEVEAERLRTALLSSLSHDMRTPLGRDRGRRDHAAPGRRAQRRRRRAGSWPAPSSRSRSG